jgi:hypothetical protein
MGAEGLLHSAVCGTGESFKPHETAHTDTERLGAEAV